jgi:multiple sugar transport system substrate-binding protein
MEERMSRRISFTLAAILLGACGVVGAFAQMAPNTALKGEITQWVWGDYEMKGAADFNKYFPNIKVNYVSIASGDYTKKLQATAASGGELPDVVNLEMTPRGMLVNLDIWENLDKAPYNAKRGDLAPWSIPLVTNAKGELVSIQIDNCVGGFTYNRALAKQYFGTDDPAKLEKIFTSMDVYLQKGKEVAEKSNGKISLFSGASDTFWGISGMNTKEPFVKNGKLNMDSSVWPAFQLIEKLVKAKAIGKYSQWTPAWNASFGSNTVIFYPSPSWFITWALRANDRLAKDKYGLISPPGGGFSWGGTSYAIPKTSKNKELAWAYVKWFTMSMEGTKSFMRAWSTPTTYQPSYATDLYTSDANKDPFYAGQNYLAKLIEISRNPKTMTRPMTIYDQTVQDSITPVLEQMGQGISAKEAYDKLKKDILEKLPELSM